MQSSQVFKEYLTNWIAVADTVGMEYTQVNHQLVNMEQSLRRHKDQHWIVLLLLFLDGTVQEVNISKSTARYLKPRTLTVSVSLPIHLTHFLELEPRWRKSAFIFWIFWLSLTVKGDLYFFMHLVMVVVLCSFILWKPFHILLSNSIRPYQL